MEHYYQDTARIAVDKEKAIKQICLFLDLSSTKGRQQILFGIIVSNPVSATKEAVLIIIPLPPTLTEQKAMPPH